MTTTIKTEATRILTIAGIDVENKVLSCSEGDPLRTDDDTCLIDEMDWQKIMSGNAGEGHNSRKILVDDLFSRANAQNLARKMPPELDTHNYFFRLDPNAVFFRREQFDRTNLGEGGLLFRGKGSVEWRQLDLASIKVSPELTEAVVHILLNTLRARTDYDRLNGHPHHGDDYEYAQAKAVMWLNELIPSGDSSYRDILLQAFPSMNADGQFFAWYRFQSEGRGSELQNSLIAMLDDPTRGQQARSLLRDVSPVSPEHWSLKSVIVPQFTAESFGAAYFPLQLREAPPSVSWRGEKEPLGSYTVAGAGIQVCVGPEIDCAQRLGPRFGAMLEAGAMLNGHGYYTGSLKLFGGNEYIVGFAEGGVNIFPTGGFPGEGYYGDIITHGALGAGLRIAPYPKLPIAFPAGIRFNPEDPRDAAFYAGFGGVY